jgi:hypothetical protein
MKTKIKFVINLVEWNLLPVTWNFDNIDLNIEHKRYYFLCFKFEIYKKHK